MADDRWRTTAQSVGGYSLQFYLPVDVLDEASPPFDEGADADIDVVDDRAILLTPPWVDVDRDLLEDALHPERTADLSTTVSQSESPDD